MSISTTVYRDFSINPLGNYIESIFQKWREYHLFYSINGRYTNDGFDLQNAADGVYTIDKFKNWDFYNTFHDETFS